VTVNVASGLMFLMAFPDQYAYNPAFDLKVVALP
jgi:hypothetical protein